MITKIGALIAHCIFFWGPYVRDSFKQARTGSQPDPHWQVRPPRYIVVTYQCTYLVQAMQKYEEAPWWWFMILLALSFFAGVHFVLLVDRVSRAD